MAARVLTFVVAEDGRLINLDHIRELVPHRKDVTGRVTSYLCVNASDGQGLGEVSAETLRGLGWDL